VTIGDAIENAVKCHTLDIVADMANARKHLVRDWHRAGAYGTSTDVTVCLGQNRPVDVVYTITLSDGSQMVAQDLVKDAVAAWRSILVRIRLLPP
jgi:hypothetical protein